MTFEQNKLKPLRDMLDDAEETRSLLERLWRLTDHYALYQFLTEGGGCHSAGYKMPVAELRERQILSSDLDRYFEFDDSE